MGRREVIQAAPRSYILAGVVGDVDVADRIRHELSDVRIGNELELHWRNEGARRRSAIAAVVAELDTTAGAVRVWREARTPGQERMRWLPGIVAGGVNAAERGDERYLRAMRPPINLVRRLALR